MKLNDKQKMMAVAGVFVVLVGGISALNYLKFSERTKLLGQMDKLGVRETDAQRKIRQIPDLLETRAGLVEAIDRYAEILPPEAHVQHDAFVEIIDRYRQDTEILIQKADYVKLRDDKKDKAAADESFIRHRYRFSLLSTVPDFVQFMNKIENHTRFLKVDSFKIKPYEGSERTNIEGGLSAEERELVAAENMVKEIELTISTYTYRGAGSEVRS